MFAGWRSAIGVVCCWFGITALGNAQSGCVTNMLSCGVYVVGDFNASQAVNGSVSVHYGIFINSTLSELTVSTCTADTTANTTLSMLWDCPATAFSNISTAVSDNVPSACATPDMRIDASHLKYGSWMYVTVEAVDAYSGNLTYGLNVGCNFFTNAEEVFLQFEAVFALNSTSPSLSPEDKQVLQHSIAQVMTSVQSDDVLISESAWLKTSRALRDNLRRLQSTHELRFTATITVPLERYYLLQLTPEELFGFMSAELTDAVQDSTLSDLIATNAEAAAGASSLEDATLIIDSYEAPLTFDVIAQDLSTEAPSSSPTLAPTISPTLSPTLSPTIAPTSLPTIHSDDDDDRSNGSSNSLPPEELGIIAGGAFLVAFGLVICCRVRKRSVTSAAKEWENTETREAELRKRDQQAIRSYRSLTRASGANSARSLK